MWKGKKRSTGKKYTYDPIGIGVCLRCRGRAGSGVPVSYLGKVPRERGAAGRRRVKGAMRRQTTDSRDTQYLKVVTHGTLLGTHHFSTRTKGHDFDARSCCITGMRRTAARVRKLRIEREKHWVM